MVRAEMREARTNMGGGEQVGNPNPNLCLQ